MCDTKNIVFNGVLLDDYILDPKMLNIKNMISPKPKKIKFMIGNVLEGMYLKNERERNIIESVKKGLRPLFDSVFLPNNIGEDIIAFVDFDTKNKYILVDCINKCEFKLLTKDPEKLKEIIKERGLNVMKNSILCR